MRRTAPIITTSLAAAAAILAAGSTVALAQSDDPLAGPRVNDTPVPGTSETFAGGKTRFDRAERIPRGSFMHAIRALETEAPEDLRLTEEQSKNIKALAELHKAQMRIFIQENRDELRAMREQMRQLKDMKRRRGPAAPEPGAEPPMSREEMEDIKAQLQTLRDRKPDDEKLRAQVWDILNQDQQAFVTDYIDSFEPRQPPKRWRAERGSRGAEMRHARPRHDLGPQFTELRDELAKLPSEQRDQAIQRMLNQLRDTDRPE